MFSENHGPNNITDFDQLIEAARQENWNLVDAHIQIFCEDEHIVDWALNSGIKSEDGNERDLAVSLLEKSTKNLGKQGENDLLGLTDSDDNPYVRFRAAFALFSHGDRSRKVVDKIQEAAKDEDVKEIARGYLDQVED